MSRRPPITAGGGDENLGPLETVGPDDSQSEAFESLLRQVARVPLAAEGTTGEPEPGVVIADRFEILREIGRGGFARVFEARDRVLSRSVAIKLLKRRRRLNDSEVELFYREARATARLNDPRIVTAYDWGVWNGAPFLVLELLDGEPLQTLLARGPLGETRAWGIVSQIAQALAYAHSLGVLHLDLKSQNVFVLQDGRIKVLDFGLAGLDWEEEVPGQLTRVAGGTPATMAPEQADSTGTDARADIWAVGVIVHQMLFGRMPEKLAVGADRVSVPAGASTRAQAVLARTLARDPRARYPDAEALAAAVTDTSGRSRPGRRMPNARTLFALAFPPLLVAAVGFWQLRRTDYFWRNPLAGARYERLTDFEGGEHSAAISRDGKSVAFLSSRDGPVGVFITQIGTGTFRNLTRAQVPEQLVNREIRTLQFSPDGGRLYFWVGESDTARRPISTWVVPIGGGEPRLVYEQVPELAWSPDGRSLAWHTSAPGDPMFVQATTGETRPLYSPGPPRHAHFQTWSPDGEFIYFVQGSPPSQMDIWRIRPTGGPPERITFHNSRVSYPTFLDRSTLLYLATGANQSGPWIYGLDVERRMPHR
jgi:Tol biopolymer transport system component